MNDSFHMHWLHCSSNQLDLRYFRGQDIIKCPGYFEEMHFQTYIKNSFSFSKLEGYFAKLLSYYWPECTSLKLPIGESHNVAAPYRPVAGRYAPRCLMELQNQSGVTGKHV